MLFFSYSKMSHINLSRSTAKAPIQACKGDMTVWVQLMLEIMAVLGVLLGGSLSGSLGPGYLSIAAGIWLCGGARAERLVALRRAVRSLAKQAQEAGLLGTESLWPLGHLFQLSGQTQRVPGRQPPEGVLNAQSSGVCSSQYPATPPSHRRTCPRLPALFHPRPLCVFIPAADRYLWCAYFMPRMELGSAIWP